MNKIKSLLPLFLIFLLIPLINIAQNSKKYNSEDKKIGIKFPSAFELEQDISTTKVSATNDGETFFFSYTIHETQMVDHQDMANVSLEAFNEALNGKIETESLYSYKGHKGKQAKISIPDQGVCYYKVVLIGQYQFQMIWLSPEDKTSKGRDIFFKSFKFKGI